MSKKIFINIPKEWAEYLTQYEYPVIKKDRTHFMKKGGEIRTRFLDLYDLAILDEINSFRARGGVKCFKSAAALADTVGLHGKIKGDHGVCDRILQLCGLGFVEVSVEKISKYSDYKLILTVNEEAVNQAIDEVKSRNGFEEIKARLSEENYRQFMLSGTSDKPLKDTLKEYIKEYVKEYSKEYLTRIETKTVQGPAERQMQVYSADVCMQNQEEDPSIDSLVDEIKDYVDQLQEYVDIATIYDFAQTYSYGIDYAYDHTNRDYLSVLAVKESLEQLYNTVAEGSQPSNDYF